MDPVHNSKKEKASFNYPGALLLLWTVFAFIVAIIIYVRLGGDGRSNLDGIFVAILLVLLISPVAKYLHPSLRKENQGLILRKIERLIERGKTIKQRS
jgi:membrane protein implicated in regulation of membrane protease activity